MKPFRWVATGAIAALAASGCSASDAADPRTENDAYERFLEFKDVDGGVPLDEVEQPIIADAVLDVRAEGCGPLETFGTASLIGDRHAITAAHVVAGADRTSVISRDGDMYEVDVVLFDPDLDIAVLRTPAGIGDPLGFYDGEIGAGLTGHAAFARFTDTTVDVRTTEVEVLRHVEIETTDIYLDRDVTRPGFEIEATIDPGDSGAVVVIGGGAAGVIWARSTEREGRAWAVDIPDVVRDPSARRALVDPVDTESCTG